MCFWSVFIKQKDYREYKRVDPLLSSCLHPDTETKQGEYNSRFRIDFKPEFMLYSVCAICCGIWK